MPAKTAGKSAAKRETPKKGTAKRSAPRAPAVGAGAAHEVAPRDLTARLRELERELNDVKGALQSRSDQLADKARSLEATKRELDSIREKARTTEAEAAAARRIAESASGKIRCPRCSGSMTEYQHDVVRADRCDECHGIFFDNGELEQVLDKTLKDHDARKQGGWFSSLFGRR